MKILLTLILSLTLSGCSVLSWFKGDKVKSVEIQTKAVERTRLNIADPTPLVGHEIKWIVITPENVDAVWKKLKEENTDLVLFGLTDDGYEQLAISMAEIRNFIAAQRIIILKYKEYYEPQEKIEDKK